MPMERVRRTIMATTERSRKIMAGNKTSLMLRQPTVVN